MTTIAARETALGPVTIRFETDQIVEVRSGIADDAQIHDLVLPGMLDLQVNGFAGVDFMTCARDELARIGPAIAATGVTAYLPTLITQPIDALCARLEVLANWIENFDQAGAAVPLGVHLEGPFLTMAKRGAHPAKAILAPSVPDFERLHEAARGQLRLLTLAPELPGASELIARCVELGVRVALGHSNASYEEAREAFERGAQLCTHFCNAMSALHHRQPGLPGAVLTTPGATLCLIPDGIHLHDAMLEIAARSKKAEEIILVTDAIAAAGLPDGEHSLAGERVTVRDGACRNAEGVLAGSTVCMDRALARWARVTNADARSLQCASSSNVAALLGLPKRGRLEVGARADLVCFSKTESGLERRRVVVGGLRAAVR